MRLLILGVPEATQEDLDLGAAAALAVFDGAGVSADDCAGALFKRGRIDNLGFVNPEDTDDPRYVMTKEELRWAELWDLAEIAGLRAVANGVPGVAARGWLKLEYDDEETV